MTELTPQQAADAMVRSARTAQAYVSPLEDAAHRVADAEVRTQMLVQVETAQIATRELRELAEQHQRRVRAGDDE